MPRRDPPPPPIDHPGETDYGIGFAEGYAIGWQDGYDQGRADAATEVAEIVRLGLDLDRGDT